MESSTEGRRVIKQGSWFPVSNTAGSTGVYGCQRVLLLGVLAATLHSLTVILGEASIDLRPRSKRRISFAPVTCLLKSSMTVGSVGQMIAGGLLKLEILRTSPLVWNEKFWR